MGSRSGKSPVLKGIQGLSSQNRKVRLDGALASEVIEYVNDLRMTAHLEDQAWLASSQMAKGLCWLGLQDAA